MMKALIVTTALLLASPALAQDDHAQMDHAKMDPAQMDHSEGENSDHTHNPEGVKAQTESEPAIILTRTDEIDAALADGGDPLVATVLGAVCDFCAMAMNKTLSKREDVAAVYVDLDAKTLNLVLKPGATLSDNDLRELVKKSGYKVETIARGPQLATG